MFAKYLWTFAKWRNFAKSGHSADGVDCAIKEEDFQQEGVFLIRRLSLIRNSFEGDRIIFE